MCLAAEKTGRSVFIMELCFVVIIQLKALRRIISIKRICASSL